LLLQLAWIGGARVPGMDENGSLALR
jgi:hypothetical protein